MKNLFLLWIVYISLFAKNIDFYFSEQQKDENLFWQFKIEGDFPQKDGFLHTKLTLLNKELPVSRQRILMKNNSATFVYGPVKGKVLSGIYKLQIIYTHKKVRETYVHKYFVGNPLLEKQQQLMYIDFLEKFIVYVSETNKSPSKKIIAKHIQQLQAQKKKQIELSSPNILAPYFAKSMFYVKKILTLQKNLLTLSDKNKRKIYRQNISHYLAEIQREIVPIKNIDEQTVEHDIEWCRRIISTLDKFTEKKSHKIKNIKIILNYFNLELEHLKKREEQYQKSSFCSKQIFSLFRTVRICINDLIQVHFIALSKKYQLDLNIEPIKNSGQIKSKFLASLKSIESVLEKKKEIQNNNIQKSYIRYFEIYNDYQKIKKAILKGSDRNQLNALKKQLLQLPNHPQRSKIAKMIYYLEKIFLLRSRKDPLTSAYITKYKLYLQDLEQNFQKSGK
ncbi:hypothetical protein [Candidatus Uabimicrobium sp. HlEnr_7]|uniref:hypothetical protein n=1 Tax=Candidatus Uabimicrobium helgolandensis TaxID=3095367 RepID=UPI003557CF0A